MKQASNANNNGSPRNQKIYSLLSILIGIALALAMAEWALGVYMSRLQRESMDPGLIQYHALLGWILAPNWQGVHRHHDYEVTYNTDGAGFRYQTGTTAQPVKHRIAVLGDSFTFGLGVNDDQTFISEMNRVENTASEDAIQFLNFAIPGTSTDQQLLLLRDLPELDSFEEILLVVYLANDILDNTLPYPLQAQQGKPLFSLINGQLELTNVPVPLQSKPPALLQQTLGTMVLNGLESNEETISYFSTFNISRLLSAYVENREYTEDELTQVFEKNLSTGLELFSAIIDEMNATLKPRNIRLRVGLLAGRDAMISTHGVSHYFQEFLRKKIINMLETKGLSVIDLMTALAENDKPNLETLFYPNDGHLTPVGHRKVANLIKGMYDSEL